MDSFSALFMVEPLMLVALFLIAILAGFIDSLAGGGGLLTVPALLAAGMPPAQALATARTHDAALVMHHHFELDREALEQLGGDSGQAIGFVGLLGPQRRRDDSYH